MASVFMAISAVISLVTIISIYREGGILKRLRATPLRPAHDPVRARAGEAAVHGRDADADDARRAGASTRPACNAPVISFALALLLSTLSILSIGFVIASLVRTARFAQPVGALIFYPMIALSGLFVPIEALPAGLQCRREAAADDLHRVAAARHLDRRVVVRAPRRRGRPGHCRRDVRGALGQGVSMGMTTSRSSRPASTRARAILGERQVRPPAGRHPFRAGAAHRAVHRRQRLHVVVRPGDGRRWCLPAAIGIQRARAGLVARSVIARPSRLAVFLFAALRADRDTHTKVACRHRG